MPRYERPLSWVLDRIAISSATVQDKGDGKWFRLRPSRTSEDKLFRMLKGQWHSIVFSNPEKFALIHCQFGRESGVWLHYLATETDRSKYLSDCHQILTW